MHAVESLAPVQSKEGNCPRASGNGKFNVSPCYVNCLLCRAALSETILRRPQVLVEARVQQARFDEARVDSDEAHWNSLEITELAGTH